MNGQNNFERDLAAKIGKIEGSMEAMVANFKRVLDNQDDTFKRLAEVEGSSKIAHSRIDDVKEDIDKTKTRAGGISAAVAAGVAGLVELARILTGGR
jgi:peptidoglycan hydrolase CwlO-like protein